MKSSHDSQKLTLTRNLYFSIVSPNYKNGHLKIIRLFMPNNTLQQTEMCVSTGLLLYINISKLREMHVTEGAGVNQRKLACPSMWNTGQRFLNTQ